MFDDDSQANQTNNQTDNQAGPAPALGGNGFGSTAPSDDSSKPDDTNHVVTAPTTPADTFSHNASISPSPSASSTAGSAGNGKLDQIKSDALAQLSPLVHKLDQSPEEKYKTLMMMVQASDDQDLLPEAYEAANQITDEKLKAEALLNIVNEVNYFTQKGAGA